MNNALRRMLLVSAMVLTLVGVLALTAGPEAVAQSGQPTEDYREDMKSTPNALAPAEKPSSLAISEEAFPLARAAAGAVRGQSGFSTNVFGANDDESTELVEIGFTIDFFGIEHNTLYVNNNGNVTFDAPQSEYTPYDLTSTSREIIAVFFADVDTRGLGSGLVTYGNDTVNGRPAFGVNWFNTGYYSHHVDKLNTFQLILIDRSDIGPGDFDIEFNYSQIEWETGDASGGTGGLGGVSARVGFSNGTGLPGTSFEILGSADPGAFLDSNTSTGLIYERFGSSVLGRYRFEARNGNLDACRDATANQPIMLVPGWGSADTLDQDTNGFQTLRSHLESAQVGYVYNCNLFYAGLTAAEISLEANGEVVRNAICSAYSVVKQHRPEWDGSFDIFGHSYGGLRARAYLESPRLYGPNVGCPDHGGIVTVNNLFTFGTPHGGGQLSNPGAVYIALPYWLDSNTRSSANQLWPWNMGTWNRSHSQPADVCYHLVGGDVYGAGSDVEGQDLPWYVDVLYNLVVPNALLEHDLGVYQSSAHELGDNDWSEAYPNIVTYSTPDIHGYFEQLSEYRTYFGPGPWHTFNIIDDRIGTSATSCAGLRQRDSASRSSVSSFEDTGSSRAVIATGTLETSQQQHVGTFEVNDSGQTAVLLEWPIGELAFTLTDPNTNLITPESVDSNHGMAYLEGATIGNFGVYVFETTRTGIWTYEITMEGDQDDTVPYKLTHVLGTPITLQGSVSDWQRIGESVSLSAELVFDGSQPILGSSVTAQIYRPDGTEEQLVLLDNGSNSDQQANDGIYSGQYQNTNVGGLFNVQFDAEGIHDGLAYTRSDENVFAVAGSDASLTGNYVSSTRDNNQDGLSEWLDIDVTINVTIPGRYTLSGALRTASDIFVDHTSQSLDLPEGTQTVTLSFDGDEIRASRHNGPYTLSQLMLIIAGDGGLLLEDLENVHTTDAYLYTMFGSVSWESSTFLSPLAMTTLNGIRYDDEDILTYDETIGEWSLYLDGSAVGLKKTDINAFHILEDGDILMSFDRPIKNLPGMQGILVDDSDIVRFTPIRTALPTITDGQFELYFDGSDVNLRSGGEDIDAITLLDDGRIILSTQGTAKIEQMVAKDEDLLVFSPTQLGDNTAGTFELFLDGSDIHTKLNDIAAVHIESNGDILMVALKKFSYDSIDVNPFDVMRCVPRSLGEETVCDSVDFFWRGADFGLNGRRDKIDGFSIANN